MGNTDQPASATEHRHFWIQPHCLNCGEPIPWNERDTFAANQASLEELAAAKQRVAALEAALRFFVDTMDSSRGLDAIIECYDKARQLLSEEVSHE